MSHIKPKGIFLLSCLTLALTGCGGGDSSDSSSTNTNPITPTNPTNPTNPTTPTTSAVVGLMKTGLTQCANTRNGFNGLQACSPTTIGADWFGLKQDGEVQAGITPNYQIIKSANLDECILDSGMNLTWELKPNDSSYRDKDNLYTWYNPDMTTNGGTVGSTNSGKNTYAYIQSLNANNYCGHNDWRLPTIDELNSIVNYQVNTSTTSVPTIFVETDKFDGLWSSTPNGNSSSNNYAYFLNVNLGSSETENKLNTHKVIAVRSN